MEPKEATEPATKKKRVSKKKEKEKEPQPQEKETEYAPSSATQGSEVTETHADQKEAGEESNAADAADQATSTSTTQTEDPPPPPTKRKRSTTTSSSSSSSAPRKRKREQPYGKKPLNAYMFYFREKAKEENLKALKVTELARTIALFWGQLTQDEKQPYVKMAMEAKAEYEERVKKMKAEEEERLRQSGEPLPPPTDEFAC